MESSMNNDEIIIFSELSQKEKVKYFNFFLENDIEFEKEEEGTYLAEMQLIREEKKEEEKENSQQRSISPQKTNGKRDYEVTYAKVLEVIHPVIGIKGKKMELGLLRFLIQEMYSLRFVKDTQALANQEENQAEPFPYFVGNFFVNKFQKKTILHQHSVDFLLSLDFYSRTNKDIALFAKFLSEEYDVDDLIFFLFVRSCIEKELKIFFIDKAKEDAQSSSLNTTEINIPLKLCRNIAQSIFGDEKDLLTAFVIKADQLANESSKKNLVEVNSIMLFSVDDYHISRFGTHQISSFNAEDLKTNNSTNNNYSSLGNNNNTDTFNRHSLQERQQKNYESANKRNRNSSDLREIIISTNSDKCQNETEKKTGIKKILNAYIKKMEIDNHIKNLLNSNKSFDGINQSMIKDIENIKDMALKKLSVMINQVVVQNKAEFMSFLKLREKDLKGNQKYQLLQSQLSKLLKVKNLLDINEDDLINFIQTLLNIPEFNNQISQLLLKLID